MLENLYKPITDLLLNRYPIKVIASGGMEPPTVVLSIVNHTASLPVYVHEVRVHYGSKERSRSFSFMPHGVIKLEPKQSAKWFLSFKPYETKIALHFLTKDPTDVGNQNGPGIESPAQLFNAIGMGDKSKSWVTINFNEYKDRRFLHGSIKGPFDMVGKQHRAGRRKENG